MKSWKLSNFVKRNRIKDSSKKIPSEIDFGIEGELQTVMWYKKKE